MVTKGMEVFVGVLGVCSKKAVEPLAALAFVSSHLPSASDTAGLFVFQTTFN